MHQPAKTSSLRIFRQRIGHSNIMCMMPAVHWADRLVHEGKRSGFKAKITKLTSKISIDTMTDKEWESTPLDGIPGGCSEARNVSLRFWMGETRVRVGGRSCIKFQCKKRSDRRQFWFVGIERDWTTGQPLGTIEELVELPDPSTWRLSTPRKLRSNNVMLRIICITFDAENKMQLSFLISDYEDNGKHFIRALQAATTLREDDNIAE